MPRTTKTEPNGEGVVIYIHGQRLAEVTQQATVLRRYCQHAGLEVATGFHDLEGRTIGLDMALRAIEEPGVRYLCTTNWPPAALSAEEALSVRKVLGHHHTSLLTIDGQAMQGPPHLDATNHQAVGDAPQHADLSRPGGTSTERRPQ